MYQKKLFILCLLLTLLLATAASALHYWDNHSGDGSWMTLDNWSSTKLGDGHTAVTTLPSAGDGSYILVPENQQVLTPPAADVNCTIPVGQSVASAEFKVGNYNYGHDEGIDLYVYGSLSVSSTFWIGTTSGPVGTYNNACSLIIDGGEVTVSGPFNLGTWANLLARGHAKIFIENGGTLTTNSLGLYGGDSGFLVGEVYVNDGTINIGSGGLKKISASIIIDISDTGVIYLDGDETADVQSYVDDGYIILNGAATPLDIEVSYDINTDKTVVRKATEEWKHKAKNPEPGSTSEDVSPDVVLNWEEGQDSTSTDLYLGTSLDDVNYVTATPLVSGVTGTSYDSTTDYLLDTTYYWRVDEYDGSTTWQGPVWTFTTTTGKAENPSPTNAATGVAKSGTLTWDDGFYASSHDVYLGMSKDDVEAATQASSQFKENVATTSYDYDGLIREQTYYWRVDEVNDTTSLTVKGDAWKFTVEGFSGSATILSVTPNTEDTAAGRPAINIINGSGLDETKTYHSEIKTDMWSTTWVVQDWTSFVDANAIPLSQAWVALELAAPTAINDMKIWNFNRASNTFMGLQEINIYYSAVSPASDNPADWSVIKTTLPEAPGTADYHYIEPTIDFGGAIAKFVVIAANDVNGHWTSTVNSPWGLSEVIFSASVPFATNPYPADGNELDQSALSGIQLQWTAAAGVTAQNIYFGEDYTGVLFAADINDAAYLATVGDANYYNLPAAKLDLGGQYYWRIDSVSAETERGQVWSFSVIDHVIVDDMERYDTDSPLTIDYWDDMWAPNGTGAELAYKSGNDYIEMDIVHGGQKAMYMTYDNAGYNESRIDASFGGSYALLCGTDLTVNGLAALEIWYYGDPANGQDTMFITLSDGTNTATVTQDADLTAEEWTSWLIALSDFSGVNLAAADTMSFGIGTPGGTTPSGATGILLLDDFALFTPSCRPEFTDDCDLNGDCVVDNKDLKMLCGDWLEVAVIGNAVAFFEFEDDATDSLGSQDATEYGTPTYTAGYNGQALTMDQVSADQYLIAPDGGSTEFESEAWTIDCWINPDVTALGWRYIYINGTMGAGTHSGARYELIYNAEVNKFCVALDDDDVKTAFYPESADFNLPGWKHVALVRDVPNGMVKFYYNGVLSMEVEDGTGSIASAGEPLYVGACPTEPFDGTVRHDGSANPFIGQIDSLRFLNYPMTAGQVAEAAAGAPAVAQFPLVDNADDVAGTQDGTAEGGLLFTDGVANFDGVDDYINVPDGGTTELATGDFTISLWSYVPVDFTGYGIFAASGAWHNPGVRYEFGPNAGTYFMAIDDGDTLNKKSTCTIAMDPFPYDQWVYVAITRDYGNEVAIYVNGEEVISTGDITSSISSPKDLRIGADHDGHFLKGMLSDVRFYDRVVSEAEMAIIMVNRSAALTTDINGDYTVNFGDFAEMLDVWMDTFLWP